LANEKEARTIWRDGTRCGKKKISLSKRGSTTAPTTMTGTRPSKKDREIKERRLKL